MIFGLIPAAGHSTRMGRPKLSLRLGDRTVIEQVIGVLRSAGVERILVVTGPHVPELVPLARNAAADVLALDAPTADMRRTIEHGLAWIERFWQPATGDAFLLVPADHPALDSRVVLQLLDARRSTDHSIIIPTFRGKRGHPTLIDWRHAPDIHALPDGVGLNVLLRQQGESVLELPVDAASILDDMDTPEDYERMRHG